MMTYEFEIIVTGPLDEAASNRLFEAGCDDALPSNGPAGARIAFGRRAPTFTEAVLSALADVESAGFEPLRVAPDDYVWAAEIAERLGRTRQSVDMLVKGSRGPGDFPAPVHGSDRNPLWRWSEVAEWFAVYEGRSIDDDDRAATIAAINGVLEARRGLRKLPPRERRRVLTLAR